MFISLFTRRGGSSRHLTAAFSNALLALFSAATLHAQLAGSISVKNLPALAAGPSAMDPSGNLYIGTAAVAGAPVTAGAAQTQFGGNACPTSGPQSASAKIGILPAPPPCLDAYLTKVDPNGNTIYATYLGGPQNDSGAAVAIDSSGALYVTGMTGGNFPTTAKAALTTSTTSATFAAKLDKTGATFLYATYLPPSIAAVSAIAVDSQGNAYIAGTTTSKHAVVVEVSADGASFLYTTTLGGTGQDSASGIVIDSSGDAIVSGLTASFDFPVTAGVVQSKFAGYDDQFIVKLDPTGKILFATYLGGSGEELGASLQTDLAGNIYIAGRTWSTNFPTTAGSFQATGAVPIWNSFGPGGFLTSLSPDGHIVRYSTYIPTPDGMSNAYGPSEIAVGPAGDVYLLNAALASWPVTPSAPQPCYNGAADTFLAHFGTRGEFVDSTYLGQYPFFVSLPGNNYLPRDGSIAMISDNAGANGNPALLSVRFGEPGWTTPACLTPMVLNGATLTAGSVFNDATLTPTDGVIAPGEVVSLVGYGIGPSTGVVYQPGVQGQAPRTLGGVQVFFNGIQAPILYAQSNQVNAIVPVELSGQTSTTVTLQYQNTTLGPFTQQLAVFAPAIFRWQPGVSTQAAALNQDGSTNGPANPAAAGSIVSVWGTGLGPLATPCSTGNPNSNAAVFLAPGYSTVVGSPNTKVWYSGGAPQLLCGVMQINLQIPAGTPSGNFLLIPEAIYQSADTLIDGAQANLGATIVVK